MENTKSISKKNIFLASKKFLLEDDCIITEDDQLKFKNKNFSIHDFRFFDNNIKQSPTIIYINTDKINDKFLKLFSEIQGVIITQKDIVRFKFLLFFNKNLSVAEK